MSTTSRSLISVLIVVANVAYSTHGAANSVVNTNSAEINNLLMNDLNVIATKIDDIPETSLNLKLVLMAYECNDVKLNWKISQQPSTAANKKQLKEIFKVSPNGGGAAIRKQNDVRIFGYQVVVREYLESNVSSKQSSAKTGRVKNSEEIFEKQSDKTVRVYSSKFIESNQNKFKLINLLRRDQANYLICLIIYMDVTETVAFEKQCVNFSLPEGGGANVGGKPCDRTSPSAKHKIIATTTSTTINPGPVYKQKQPQNGGKNATAAQPTVKINCEHVSQCRHYSNLIVAFVVCGVLLGANVFMFTIIIIQNTIKLGLLRHKLKVYKKSQGPGQGRLYQLPAASTGSTHYLDQLDDKLFQPSGVKFNGCGRFLLTQAFRHTCADILRAVCCGQYKQPATNPANNINNLSATSCDNKSNNIYSNNTAAAQQQDIMGNIRSKFGNFALDSTTTESCTTITRPGYILQVPSVTSSSVLNMSSTMMVEPKLRAKQVDKKKKLKSSSKSNALINQANSPNNDNDDSSGSSVIAASREIENHNYNITSSHGDDNLTSPSLDFNPAHKNHLIHSHHVNNQHHRMSSNNFDNYENEIFYHIPNKLNASNSQVSSAF